MEHSKDSAKRKVSSSVTTLENQRDLKAILNKQKGPVARKFLVKNRHREIPRWRLEGGSRKQASYSEILERRWRHTLQA
jgi:hypothetical protein